MAEIPVQWRYPAFSSISTWPILSRRIIREVASQDKISTRLYNRGGKGRGEKGREEVFGIGKHVLSNENSIIFQNHFYQLNLQFNSGDYCKRN